MSIGTGFTCDIIEQIERNSCLGNALLTMNQNFSAIDLAMCKLTNYYGTFLRTRVVELSARLDLAVKQRVPVGTIQQFSYIHQNTQNLDAVLPFGWYPCIGQTILISDHQSLANILYIGNAKNNDPKYSFGFKCTSTGTRSWNGLYIKLPDLRGYFVRGQGKNSDAIQSDKFGYKVLDTFQGHKHDSTNPTHSHPYTEPNEGKGHRHKLKKGRQDEKGFDPLLLLFSNGWWRGDDKKDTTYETIDITIQDALTNVKFTNPISDGSNGLPRVDFETRPRNIAIQYGIKWYNDMI